MTASSKVFAALLLVITSIAMQSCKHKAPANIAPAEKENVSYTPRVADISRANGQVNDIDLKTFTSLIVENDLQKLSFNCPIPCIIDFYATWCGPCMKLAPHMEEMALKYKGKVAFYHVDVDKQQEFAQLLGIESLPTILFAYQNNGWGEIGYMDNESLERKIKILLNQKK